MTNEKRLVLTETRRLWIQTARSRNPHKKVSEPEYEEYFLCPACKHHEYAFIGLNDCPGNCILSPVWGSTGPKACAKSPLSPYDEWCALTDAGSPDSRRIRSAAWKLVNGIETMLWNERLTNA